MITITLKQILGEFLTTDAEFICNAIWNICERDYGADLPVCDDFRRQWCRNVLHLPESYSYYIDGWNTGTHFSVAAFEGATYQDFGNRKYRIWMMEKVLQMVGNVQFQFGVVASLGGIDYSFD